MFYCDKCASENEWPIGFYGSTGPCEICGKVSDCNDVPSKFLPIPKKKKQPPKTK
jgi:hypothetical protein